MTEALWLADLKDWLAERGEFAEPSITPLHRGSAHQLCRVGCSGHEWTLRVRYRSGIGYVSDHERETACWRQAAQANLAPPLLASLRRGSLWLYDYVPDSPASTDAAELGQLMAGIHTLKIDGHKIDLRHQLMTYRKAALAQGIPAEQLPDPTRDALDRAMLALEKEPAVLCHNDLQSANVLGAAGNRLAIDWEYAGMGSPYFDAAATLATLPHPAHSRFLDHAFPDGWCVSQLQRATDVYAATASLWQACYGPGNGTFSSDEPTHRG